MKISYNWLQEHIDIKMETQRLAELLTMAGMSVDSVSALGDDHVFEIEVTSNRPDLLSVIGVAREVAALTGKKLKVPLQAPVPRSPFPASRMIKISIEDKKLCPRYTGRVIENVKVAESPKWLKDRIAAVGLRPVNNIVDITNFCLFELGEPMHAFDLDKIAGAAIIIRKAKKGEKIITIDGIERNLDETVLVIADKDKPIAIAGVMGGLGTEVTQSTRNILLEAAVFDPISIRRTARRLGVSTESSYRFERKVDPESVLCASDRASALIEKEADGSIGKTMDIGIKIAAKGSVALRYSGLQRILGLPVPFAEVKKILKSLGFRIKGTSGNVLRLETPSFRQDIKVEVDLIEEVARIWGYDKIPLTIPPIPSDQAPRVDAERIFEGRIRGILTACGFDEALNLSLLSANDLESANMLNADIVSVENPLSAEQEVMRPSLVPGLLKSVAWNINRKAKEISLFEIGNTYLKSGAKGFIETKHLSIILSGSSTGSWKTPPQECSLFDLKGALEVLLKELGLEDVCLIRTEHPVLLKGSSASIDMKGVGPIGFIGEVSQETLGSYSIKQKVYAAELSLVEIFRNSRPSARYHEPPRYPSVTRDVSIIVDKGVENSRILGVIRETGGRIVSSVETVDLYSGRQIPSGKIGFTYRIEYLDPSKTLEDTEINTVHSKVCNALTAILGAELR